MNKYTVIMWDIIFNVIAILFYPLPLRKNRVIFNSAENRSYNYNSKYFFEFIKEYHKEYEVYFVINDEELRQRLSIKYGKGYFINTNSLKSCMLILRSKFWIISTLESPYICFVKNHKRIVYHLGHGVPLKAIGQLAKFPSKMKLLLQKYLRIRPITHVLCYSDEYKKNMSAIFNSKHIQYVPLGQPRNDSIDIQDSSETIKLIKEKIPDLPCFEKAILYSPTWRPYEKTRFFPWSDVSAVELNRKLIEANTILFLRGHPFFESSCPLQFEHQSNIKWLNNDVISDITSHLAFFDKLITDYSSIFIDYLCVNNPIGFLQYDYDKYERCVGFALGNKDIFCGEKLDSSDKFTSFISSENDFWISERLRIARVINVKNTGNNFENKQFIDILSKN